MKTENVIDIITNYIRRYVKNAGAKGVVIGISGGVDSAVSAYLACKALTPEKVQGLVLPYRTTAPKSLEDAGRVIENLGIESKTIDITPQLDAYFDKFDPQADKLRVGNKAARERMSVLYDWGQKNSYLVFGTSNKTEWLLGYFTLWGDMGAAFEPLGDLYKTQVWELAQKLGVPRGIIEKSPTADLWPDQTDEEELGLPYKEIDEILYLTWEEKLGISEMVDLGWDREKVEKVLDMVCKTQFKRKMPDILSLQSFLEPLILK